MYFTPIVALLTLILFSCYSPKYTYRVLMWQESDYDDGEKFKYSTIYESEEVFNFEKSELEKSEAEISRLTSCLNDEDFIQFLINRGTYSFLVIRNDSVLIEKYFNGSNRETLQNTFSVSKSILAMAVAKAIDLDYIKSTEEPIVKYIPELLERDKNFSKITIGHLLSMRSGIKYSPETGFPWVNKDNVMTYYHPNLRKVAINKTKIENAPNEEFLYNNYNPLLIGLMMERTTKMKLSKFIEEFVWTKIGTEFGARWSTDENEFEKMESGFMATPIDMAKIGRLVLNNGKYNGSQILPENILRDFIKPKSEIKIFENRYWGYGSFWWSVPDGSENPCVMANGHMGQFIFLNPKTNYIIIRNGLKVGKFYDDDWVEIFKNYTKE